MKIEDITARLFKASVRLEKSSDFAAQISRITTLLREQILPFVQLSYYQLDHYPDSVYHYFLHPLPIGREETTLDENLAEVQAWRQRRHYIWHETEELPRRRGLSLPLEKGVVTLALSSDEPICENWFQDLEKFFAALEVLIVRYSSLLELEMLRAQERATDEDLRALYDGSHDLSGDESHEVVHKMVQMIKEKLNFDRGGVFLVDEEAQLLRGALGVDDRGSIIPITSTVFPLYPQSPEPTTEAALIARGELPYFLTQDLDGEGHESIEGDIKASLAVPMRIGGRIIGMMAGDNYFTNKPIYENQLRPFMILANQGAIALERARLFSSLKSAHSNLETQVKERTADLSQSNEQLKNTLREREILLKEIHHRVKNNLQVISSMFNLQQIYVGREDIRQVLREGDNRLHAMALIHESLYQSANLKDIDLADYLSSLAKDIFTSYETSARHIKLSLQLDALLMEANPAVNLGMIVNELLSNALKHGFPDRRQGLVELVLQREGAEVVLLVRDNGIGIGEDFEKVPEKSMGMQVVNVLVKQLGGTLQLENSAGTMIEMRFPASSLLAAG